MSENLRGNPDVRSSISAAMRTASAAPAPEHDANIIRSRIEGPLLDHFAQKAEEAGMHTARIRRDDLPARISSLLHGADDGPVLLEPALAEEEPALRELDGCLLRPSEEELFSAAAGIVAADAAIAETGSLARAAGPDRPRGFALVPMTVIIVLRASRITADLYEYLGERDARNMPSELVLITGPSKTADIGMKLVTGIHGPGVVHVVIIEDG
ncbi:MAG: LUD domain-containing protein [Planctomycetota bacterium]|nr:LUD domain-containing protein [Planctomycetota bacterium]